ncbi:MAG TPA: hypothetical protein VF669_23250 [Tepidisphaeraceae bacterium]|jgi:hypothetical protein
METTIIVPHMGGVTTALVLFIFAALLYPSAIKNRTQFYAGFTGVVLILLLYSLDVMIRTTGFQVFSGAITGLLQVFALLMFFMSAGGVSAGELADEMKRAYEVIRRGEDEKTVIVPLTGEMPKPRNVDVPATRSDTLDRPSIPLDDDDDDRPVR